MSFVTRGFRGRRGDEGPPDRIPARAVRDPGLPRPVGWPDAPDSFERVATHRHRRHGTEASWTWDEFRSLPTERITVDIHCVTKWSKLDTTWEGVSVDTLLAGTTSGAGFAYIHSYGGYTTNLPVADLTGGKAWIAFSYDGEPLAPEHGGPARPLVPHLYFWKSAKWVRGMELAYRDRPGFWESYGYHIYGDPWKEQRYSGD